MVAGVEVVGAAVVGVVGAVVVVLGVVGVVAVDVVTAGLQAATNKDSTIKMLAVNHIIFLLIFLLNFLFYYRSTNTITNLHKRQSGGF